MTSDHITTLAGGFTLLCWCGHAASFTLCWSLVHFAIHPLKVVQPAETQVKWSPPILHSRSGRRLVVRLRTELDLWVYME